MAVEQVVIVVKGDDKQLDSTLQKLERLGVIDKKNATQFKKTSEDFRKDQKKTQNSLEKTGASLAKIVTLSVAAFGIQRLVGNAINIIKDYDESIANLRKTTGLSADATRDLADQIRKIKTKTSITALLDLATAAGRLGLKGKDIVGFTIAADKAFVALGDSLEGSAEDIALTLGKLASSFNLDKEFGVGNSIERIGSALNELGANSKATEGPIVDFTRRLAGVASQAGISLTDIAALGALFDSTGQSIEVAATTMNILLPAIGKDVQKFAKVAGVSIEEFTRLIETDAIEALKLVAIGAKSNQDGLLGLSETLESFGVDSARAASIVGILANKTDELTRLQAIASKGLKENTSLTNEFNIKNNTLSASTDKLGKAYDNFIISIDDGTGPLSSALKGVVEFATALLQGKSASLQATEALLQGTAALIDANREFAAQEDLLNSLISEHETLTAKTSLNKDEQERLRVVIQQIGKEMPTVISAFNDLGEAIEINTAKVRENLTLQKQALGIRNKSQIVDLREEIDKLNRSTERNTASLRLGTREDITFTKSGRALVTVLKLTSEEIQNLQEQNILNRDSLISTTKSIVDLGGELTVTEKSIIGVAAATDDLVASQKETAETATQAAKTLGDLKKQQSGLRQELDGLIPKTDEFIAVQKELKKVSEQIAIATGKETDAMKKLKKAREKAIKESEKLFEELIKDAEKKAEEDQKVFDAERKARVDILDVTAKTESEKLNFIKERVRLELAAVQGKVDQEALIIAKGEKDKADIEQEFAEKRKSLKEKEDEEDLERREKTSQNIQEAVSASEEIIGNLRQVQTNKELADIGRRESAIKQQLASDLKNTRLTEEEKTEIQRQADEELKVLRKERAEADKRQAIFNIILNTAVGIVSALASVPPNIPLSITIAAIGASELAIVASEPVPEFAKGTTNAPEGMAKVGEKGEEFVYLTRGAKVVRNEMTKKYADIVDSLQNDNFHQNYIHRDEVHELMKNDFATNISNSMLFNDQDILFGLQNLGKGNKKNAKLMVKGIVEGINKQQVAFKY